MGGFQLDRTLDRLTSIAVIVGVAFLVWVVLERQWTAWPASDVKAVEMQPAGEFIIPPPTSMVRGDETSAIVLMEFSDFLCPFCGRHARDVYPRLVEEFVATGGVKYVFLHYPSDRSHPGASTAAEAVECAGEQGSAWPMHDLLFRFGNEAVTDSLPAYAASLNLNRQAFEACVSRSVMAARVLEHLHYGARLNVSVTPTFLFARAHPDDRIELLARMEGARPYATFKTTLEELLPTFSDATAENRWR